MEHPHLELQVLGGFALRSSGRVLLDDSWSRGRAKAIVKVLALQPDRSMHRQRLTELLWPGHDAESGANNLHKALHHLRVEMRAHGIEPCARLVGARVVLTDDVHLDIDAFRDALAHASASADALQYDPALARYGELLPDDLTERWTVRPREALRAEYAAGALACAQLLVDAGDFDRAIAFGERALDAGAPEDDAQRILMRARTGRQRDAGRSRDGAPAAGGQRPAFDQMFVGRESLLGELNAAAADALAHHERIVLVTGTAGIGKTRAAEEAIAAAQAAGASALRAACAEERGAPAFWLWVQVIRELTRSRDVARLRRLMGAGAPEIARVVAEVRDVLPGVQVPRAADSEQARFRFFDGVAGLLRNASRVQPLAVLLDDLQWADEPSLLLLQFVARDLAQERVLFIATVRDDELAVDHPLNRTLHELSALRQTTRLAVEGFTEDEVRRFVEAWTGTRAPGELVETLHRVTAGNALFVREYVRLLTSDGGLPEAATIDPASQPVPETIRSVVHRRVEQVSAPCQALLSRASCLGRDFDVQALMLVASLTGDTTDELLDEAAAARLIQPMRYHQHGYSAGRHFQFTHALIRDVLYDEIGPRHRMRLHREVGLALEQMHGEHREAVAPELAYHWSEGMIDDADRRRAVGYSLMAGRRAMSEFAYEAALVHFERGLAIHTAAEHASDTDSCDIALAAGEAARLSGKPDRTREFFERAYDDGCAIGDGLRVAQAAAGAGSGFNDAGIVERRLIDMLEDGLSRIDETPTPLRSRLLACLGQAVRWENIDRAYALAIDGVEVARAAKDAKALAFALHARHTVLHRPDDLAERLATASELVRVAASIDDREMMVQGKSWHTVDLIEQGDMAAALAIVAENEEVASTLRQPLFAFYRAIFETNMALLEGRLHDAEAASAQVLQQALSWGHAQSTGLQIYGVQLFALRWEQGRLAEMEAPFEALSAQYDGYSTLRIALTFLYSELGREDEARAAFEAMATNDFADLARDNSWLMAMSLLAQVCTRLGDRPRARILYDLMAPFAGRNVVAGDAITVNGSSDRYLGILAGTLGEWSQACAHFDAAIALNERMGARPFIACTQRDYARMLLARGRRADRAQALALADAARAMAEALGMPALLAECEALVADLAGERDAASEGAMGSVPRRG